VLAAWGGLELVPPRALQVSARAVGLELDGMPITAMPLRSAAEKSDGLQPYTAIPHGVDAALFLFPHRTPKCVAFHMGKVAYPIDIAFCDDSGAVTRLARGEPGSLQRWSANACFVLEAHAGELPLRVGSVVRRASTSHDLLRTLSDDAALADEGEES
jgi:uncharacterized membrane protein (UPF0127 family)